MGSPLPPRPCQHTGATLDCSCSLCSSLIHRISYTSSPSFLTHSIPTAAIVRFGLSVSDRDGPQPNGPRVTLRLWSLPVSATSPTSYLAQTASCSPALWALPVFWLSVKAIVHKSGLEELVLRLYCTITAFISSQFFHVTAAWSVSQTLSKERTPAFTQEEITFIKLSLSSSVMAEGSLSVSDSTSSYLLRLFLHSIT